MTLRITVDHGAIARISNALRRLTGLDLKRLVAREVANRGLLPRLREYPPQSGKRQRFVSDKQRRAFFAKLRSGEITVPYRRTYALRQGWALVGDGFTVANTTPYMRFVQGKPGQAAYHRGNWRDVGQIAADVQEGIAGRLGIEVVNEEIGRQGLR